MFNAVRSTSRDQDTHPGGLRAPSRAQRRTRHRLDVRRDWFCTRDGAVGIVPQGFKLPGSQNRRKH